ncbi:centrosomal protein of 72 kDa [Erpetoichthys calabaricus]|uniref:centrosomal protein of 72 kDa n=1 Tax=Erpetoichthys calabaricus TaxID=27687 RepID=UPI002234B738|nr:centrosomal protein of 72 kDa [Erpetoichthys calabaricus]
MAAETLSITEQWIRERLNLQHRNLADVRSLSLPGSYEGKIGHLGYSLKNFVRLKTLDLSRNSLVSLEGIQHLKHLEKLNLYYNCIPLLKELYYLRNLSSLKELDLRLNPVVKNEPDYRLFLVHMLPNLRKLDDRPVRDSERKAAIMHFSTETLYDNLDQCPQNEIGNPRAGQPRVSYVSSLSKKLSAIDDDDEAVLNLIAKCNWDLNRPPTISGSVQKTLEAELLQNNSGGNEVLCANGYQSSDELIASKKDFQKQSYQKPLDTTEKFRHQSNLPAAKATYKKATENGKRTGEGIRVTFTDEQPKASCLDTNLKFQDEAEAYYKITGRGHFTPHPGLSVSDPVNVERPLPHPSKLAASLANESPAFVMNQNGPSGGREQQQTIPVHNELPKNETRAAYSYASQLPRDKKFRISPVHLEPLLDVVDKYWNGKKSLHCNEKFLSKAVSVLSTIYMVEETDNRKYRDEILKLKEENKVLQIQKENQENIYKSDTEGLSVQLNQARQQIASLERQLNVKVEENYSLHNKLTSMEQEILNAKNPTSDLRLGELQSHNQQLMIEIDSLKRQLQHFDTIQELTSMLQESHRTLVSTNEHLLAELEATRSRHKSEVEQLHWSYNELKKTLDVFPHRA